MHGVGHWRMPLSLTTIRLVGVEVLQSPRRMSLPPNQRGSLRFYGYREADTANRMVVIELPLAQAEEIIDMATFMQGLPDLEVEDTSWAYVAVVGPNEAKFTSEVNDNGPST